MIKTQDESNWCELFLQYQAHERNLSVHTLRAYKSDLQQFLSYLNSHSLQIAGVRSINVRTFLASLQKTITPASIARKISALRSFYRFLERHGYITQNPLVRMRRPKNSKKLPFFLTPQQIEKLLSCPSTDNILGKRDQAILELFYGSGIRVGELVNLRIDDVAFASALIKVRGKRKKERMVPASGKALQALKEYLKVRPTSICQEIFLNRFAQKLSARSIRRLFKKYANQAGLSLQISPHTLRHTYATHLLNAGANLRAVQELLGHSSLSATQIYTHVTTEQLIEVYKHTHPKA